MSKEIEDLVGSTFRFSESALDHEAVFFQTLRVHGRPRTYYVDRGAAYMRYGFDEPRRDGVSGVGYAVSS